MTKAEQTRLSSWRLKIVQQAGTGARNVARTCRHFGISRKTFYKWKRRYDEHGGAGLGVPTEKSIWHAQHEPPALITGWR